MIALVIIALVAVVALVFLYNILTMRQRVLAELARIKAEGAPVTLKDLAGPKIPPSRNAATVYAKAFTAVSSKQAQKDVELFAEIMAPQPGGKPPDWGEARRAASRYKDAIDLVEQATRCPECKYPVDWSKGALGADFPHYRPLRDLFRVLCGSAVVAARDGNTEQAVRLLDLNWRVSRSLENDPQFIGWLVRIAIVSSGIETLNEVSRLRPLSHDQALRLCRTLDEVDVRSGLARGLLGDRAMGVWVFEDMRARFTAPAAPGGSSPAGPNPAGGPVFLFRLWRDADELCYLRLMRANLDLLKRSYAEMRTQHAEPLTEPKIPKYATFTAISMPVTGRMLFRRDRTEAQIAVARAGLALEAHRARFGSYPNTLRGFAERMRLKLPKDPFSGKSLIYKRTPKGCLVYSIGPNLRDDGGRETPRSGDDEKVGDIIWRVERR